MSLYYSLPRGDNWNYQPKVKNNFKLSRSKLELFTQCPRCFYLDNRLGLKRPPGYPFNLNTAVDHLLKKEFDLHRAKNKTHPLMKRYGLKLKPFAHPELDTWRENFKGIQYHHQKTDLTVSGAVDDIWVDKQGYLYVVDYKSTSKNESITQLNQEWQIGYKRQMEVYQWLLRQNGFKVSDKGYFVYCNGRTDVEAFDGKLEFEVNLIEHIGDDSWVEQAIIDAHKCLNKKSLPQSGKDCDYCLYRKMVGEVE